MKFARMLCLILGLSLAFSSNAQSTKTFNYEGQASETVILEAVKAITLYRTEYRDSTCYRDEPYTQNECRNVTRYRQSCHWEPSYRHCWNDTDRVCRNVTRYRQQCTTGSGRQVCRNEPARRVCRTRDGVERCRNVPGRRVCRTEPGQRTCRKVPYTDRECRNETRRRCETRPGRNVCRDIPYTARECRDVTRYRQVPYACRKPVQIPYQGQKKVKNTVDFDFSGERALGNAKVEVSLQDVTGLNVKITNNDTQRTYIQVIKNRDVVTNTNTEFEAEANVQVNFGDKEELLAPLSADFANVKINKSGDLSVNIKNAEALNGHDFKIVVRKKSGKVHFSSFVNLTQFDLRDGKHFIKLEDLGFERMKSLFKIKLDVELSISVEKPSNLNEALGVNTFKSRSFSVKAKARK